MMNNELNKEGIYSQKLLKILFAFFTVLIFSAIVFPMTASAAETASPTSMTDAVKTKVYTFTKKMLLAENKLYLSQEKAWASIEKTEEKLWDQVVKYEDKYNNDVVKLYQARYKEEKRRWGAESKIYSMDSSKIANAISKEEAKGKSEFAKLFDKEKKYYEKARENIKKLDDKLKASAEKLKTKVASTKTKLVEKEKKFYANWDAKLQALGGGKYADFDWDSYWKDNPSPTININYGEENYYVNENIFPDAWAFEAVLESIEW